MTNQEIELLIKKIDHILFVDNCQFIKMNPRDYSQFVLKIYKRYEPETQTSMLKLGVVGYLHGPNHEPPKTIWVDKSIESGLIHGVKAYSVNEE